MDYVKACCTANQLLPLKTDVFTICILALGGNSWWIYVICLDASYHYREQVGLLISSIRRVENVATELYGLILYGGQKG